MLVVMKMDEKKKDLRIVKTRKALYHAFEELMKSKSFEQIKVSDICNEALINRSTFYDHYNDKYDLLEEYINSLRDSFTLEITKEDNIERNTKKYYIEIIRLLLNHIEKKKDTYVSIMINNRNSITNDIFYDILNRAIINQIDGKVISSKIPNEIITRFYIGGVTNICFEWLMYGNKYSKDDIINYIDLLIPDNFINE